MNTIQSKWESFRKDVIPEDASVIQVEEMKKAFYAGAASILGLQLYDMDETISEEAGAAMMNGWFEECKSYMMSMTQ